MKKTEPLFYIPMPENDQDAAGPYDLVQMAGLLRKKIITAETSTLREGEQDWKPFCEQPQFIIAKEMPPDAMSTRVVELTEEARAPKSFIPLPSAETLMKLGGLTVGALLAGAAAFLMAWLDTTTGYCLMAAGIGAVLVGQCMTIARLLDEDWLTLALVFFVPFGDVFYFICNIWVYFTWFCVKYVGAAVAVGAALGIATHSAH